MTEENKSWILTPEEIPESEDLLLTFPPDMLEYAGWKVGDTLVYKVQEDGTVLISKKEVVDNVDTK